MNIACLGWGSLVWDPQDLPVRRDWFADGPLLPIEFSRHSKKTERITLVIDSDAQLVRVLWSLFSIYDLDAAIESLRAREKVPPHNVQRDIGLWSSDRATSYSFSEVIGRWAKQRGLDAVIWTALPWKHPDELKTARPTSREIVDYLKRLLSQKKHRAAEEYVRRAPKQIDTDYRRDIERLLGWTPQDD